MKYLLKEYLKLVLEYKPHSNNTFYHRSYKKFKVGDILSAQKEEKTGQHWLADKNTEKALEQYRLENCPNKPSRFNCVYASFIPRSRFVNKGFLYEIEPIGNMHVADANIIDLLGNRYRKDYSTSDNPEEPYVSKYDHYLEDYWTHEHHIRKDNLNDLEILMDNAKIIRVIDNENLLKHGDVVTIPNGIEFIGYVNIFAKDYKEENPNYSNMLTYKSDGNTRMSFKEGLSLLLGVRGLKIIGFEKQQHKSIPSIKVKIFSGFSGMISTVGLPAPGGRPYFTINISSSKDFNGCMIKLENDEAKMFYKTLKAGKLIIEEE